MDLVLPRSVIVYLAEIYCVFAENPHCSAEFIENESFVADEDFGSDEL